MTEIVSLLWYLWCGIYGIFKYNVLTASDDTQYHTDKIHQKAVQAYVWKHNYLGHFQMPNGPPKAELVIAVVRAYQAVASLHHLGAERKTPSIKNLHWLL